MKDYSKAIEMYESGKSVQEVADAHGISRQAMWMALKRRNVRFRPQLRYGPDNHFFKHGRNYDERVLRITQKAIRGGRLIPQPCEICGADGTLSDGRNKVHAHHDDYNKPLKVRWLCADHHREWHENNEPIQRTRPLPPKSQKEIASMGGKATWKNRKKALAQLNAARAAR